MFSIFFNLLTKMLYMIFNIQYALNTYKYIEDDGTSLVCTQAAEVFPAHLSSWAQSAAAAAAVFPACVESCAPPAAAAAAAAAIWRDWDALTCRNMAEAPAGSVLCSWRSRLDWSLRRTLVMCWRWPTATGRSSCRASGWSNCEYSMCDLITSCTIHVSIIRLIALRFDDALICNNVTVYTETMYRNNNNNSVWFAVTCVCYNRKCSQISLFLLQ